MPYGDDFTVYVEDMTGDLGGPGGTPFWLSPDIDILGHSGQAVQGVNDVQIRVHAHEEPIIDERIVAEAYVGKPGFVLSPVTGTKRIDPGTVRFRPANLPGPEPVADDPGSTVTFQWTPSATATDIDGPGHRCLLLRAFPESLTPPTDPFDVPNEQHEAQHNIEVLTTTTAGGGGHHFGAGTPEDPRRRDRKSGLWWEEFATVAGKQSGKHFVVWALDPEPGKAVVGGVGNALKKAKVTGFSNRPPDKVSLDGEGEQIDPRELLKDREFAAQSGLGAGLFRENRLLAAASLDLEPDRLSTLRLLFDHSNVAEHSAVVLHGVQFGESGKPEGGMTVIALAPGAH